MISDLLIVLWLFVPAMVANATAMLSRFTPKNKYLDMPVDLYKTWRGKRILGDGKTVKGFVIGTCFAIFVCIVQIHIEPFRSVSNQLFSEYLAFNALIWGFLTGFGALFGDSVESFFKRQRGLERGQSWFPFDQIDYALGAIVLSLLYKQFPISDYLILMISFVLIHILSRVFWSITGFDDLSKRRLQS